MNERQYIGCNIIIIIIFFYIFFSNYILIITGFILIIYFIYISIKTNNELLESISYKLDNEFLIEKEILENKKNIILNDLIYIYNEIENYNKQIIKNDFNNYYNIDISILQNILKKKNSITDNISEYLIEKKNVYENPYFKFISKIKCVEKIAPPKKLIFFENIFYIPKSLKIKLDSLNDRLNSYYIKYSKIINDKNVELFNILNIKNNIWNNEIKIINDKHSIISRSIEKLLEKYYLFDELAIQEYHYKILEKVTYYVDFRKLIFTKFNKDNKILFIEYLLPEIDKFPNVKDYKFIKSKNESVPILFSNNELEKVYNDVLFRIVLDLINISFICDKLNIVESIVFNGYIDKINKSNGLKSMICILTILCEKQEFIKINLSKVDPLLCFKSLKGISAVNLSNMIPIKPIINYFGNDNRFTTSYNIEIDSKTNIASMNWEDFEHLIREIFEKEFIYNGGQVNVTRSSRDGGVDAIAYDPDPIRGGKIIIQAKRYTNIVGVSAVRDLYGTILNEGATKGILVTTSHFGPDSYKFANDKPITLMDGNNLLYLLEKHGYNAMINISEAKKINKN